MLIVMMMPTRILMATIGILSFNVTVTPAPTPVTLNAPGLSLIRASPRMLIVMQMLIVILIVMLTPVLFIAG
eukprot:11201308-Lingulodinium_polyedra.AAC.1